jgi:putative transposase
MSIKTYKYRISAKKTTTDKLYEVLNRCRELYNAGLQERRDTYEIMVKRHPNYYGEETRKHLEQEHAIGYYEQKRELVDLKEVRPEYQDIASHVLQDVILRVKRASDNFFRRVKHGEQPGYPRFRDKNRYDSFTYPDGAGWKLEEQTRPPEAKGMVRVNLHLSNIGRVKLYLYRDVAGTIKTLTIKRKGDHWYACFTCELGKLEPEPVSYEDVGIDLGVLHFAALSNGEFIDPPALFPACGEKAGQSTASLVTKKTREPSAGKNGQAGSEMPPHNTQLAARFSP